MKDTLFALIQWIQRRNDLKRGDVFTHENKPYRFVRYLNSDGRRCVEGRPLCGKRRVVFFEDEDKIEYVCPDCVRATGDYEPIESDLENIAVILERAVERMNEAFKELSKHYKEFQEYIDENDR